MVQSPSESAKAAEPITRTQDAFEGWMATSNYPEVVEIALAKMPDGTYRSQLTFAAWQVWQAREQEITRLRSALTESLEVLKDAGAIVKALSRWPHIVEKAEVIAEATKCADRVTAFIAKHKDSTHEP